MAETADSLFALCAAAWRRALRPAPAAAQEEADPERARSSSGSTSSDNQFLQKETLLFYVSTKPGDRYDERRLQGRLPRLWDTGFLDDLLLDVRDGAAGQDRHLRGATSASASRSSTTAAARPSPPPTSRTSSRSARPSSRSTPSTTSARRGGWRRSSSEMLAEKGRPFATVKHDAKTVGGAGHAGLVHHRRRPQGQGQGDRVRRATRVFSDGKLRGQMKKIKQTGFWNLTWLGGQDHLHRGEVGGPPGGRPAPAARTST